MIKTMEKHDLMPNPSIDILKVVLVDAEPLDDNDVPAK